MPALRISRISKKFKAKEWFYALKNVSFEVEEGETFALLGPNGAGKTTLIQIILTILIPDEGKVEIFGKDPFQEKEILTRVNFVPMERPYSHLKVKDFLASYAKLYGVSLRRVKTLTKELGLKPLENSECWMLSTGEISRISLAKALLNDPKLLILDEPTFGLDPKSKNEIHGRLFKLRKKKVTIFFASHDMLEVEKLADRIAFIKKGKVLDVKEKEKILGKFGSLEKYWLRLGR